MEQNIIETRLAWFAKHHNIPTSRGILVVQKEEHLQEHEDRVGSIAYVIEAKREHFFLMTFNGWQAVAPVEGDGA